jgi:hypothetical protein
VGTIAIKVGYHYEVASTVRHWPKEQQAAVDEFLKRTLEKGENEYECADNFRYARASMPEEIASYKRLEAEGCCGSFDEEINVTQEVIKVGFNYGH